MNIFLFFLGIFCALAGGCPPPFNDFRNLHNATRLAEAIAEYRADPQLGWETPIGDSYRRTQPCDSAIRVVNNQANQALASPLNWLETVV